MSDNMWKDTKKSEVDALIKLNATTKQPAGETAAVTWESLTPDEQEALRYLRGICELDESIDSAVLDSLVSKGLADVTNDDEWYGRDYMITIAGSIVLSQESAPGNERPSTVSAEKPRHEWQDLAPTGKAWVAEIQTDRLQQVMLFESRWDAQEFLDTQLKDTHPEHMDDAWFESETGSTLGWNGTNDFYLTLEDIFKATKLPANVETERPSPAVATAGEDNKRYTERSLRHAWLNYRLEARQLGLEPEDYLEYVYHLLNIESERSEEFAGSVLELQAALSAKDNEIGRLREALKMQQSLLKRIKVQISNIAYNVENSLPIPQSSIVSALDNIDNQCFKALSALEALAAHDTPPAVADDAAASAD